MITELNLIEKKVNLSGIHPKNQKLQSLMRVLSKARDDNTIPAKLIELISYQMHKMY